MMIRFRYLYVSWCEKYKSKPYTQGGNMKDIQDPRARPLIHLIDLLPQLADPPTFIFLENVKNFEVRQNQKKMMMMIC